MELFEAIHAHRSVRTYRSETVSDEHLAAILEAASRASSSGNMQAYSIIVTRDPEMKRRLYRPHFEQNMILEAPVFLTFCADFRRMRHWLSLSQAPMNFDNFMSFMIGAIDAVLASQNAALAAEGLGLGICYMGTTLASCLEISEILELPPGVVPVVGFSIGHPLEMPERRDRLPLNSLVHLERYKIPTDDELLNCYSERNIRGLKRYQADPELSRAMTEHGIENLAQVYTILKYTRESHLEYSKSVLECLTKQGFMNNL